MQKTSTCRRLQCAIIGAGASGLVAAKALTEAGHHVTIYEKQNCIGGTWMYSDETEESIGHEIHSSMYKSLRTNLPTEIMQYPGFPFQPSLTSFVTHQDVMNYLVQFTKHFRLEEQLEFNTRVVQVVPPSLRNDDPQGDPLKSLVSIERAQGLERHYFDKVLICTGHYSQPCYAALQGLEDFTGLVMHSHDYRTPEAFARQKILVIGKGASGEDISTELTNVAEQVYLSYTDPIVTSDDLRVHKPRVVNIRESEVIFEDGTTISVDTILMCTGYDYAFPFLSDNIFDIPPNQWNLSRETDWKVVTPLYKHMVHIVHPDLLFIGIPFKTIPFLCADVQAHWLVALFADQLALPPQDQMLTEFHQSVQNCETRVAKLHQLGHDQFAYYRDLASEIVHYSVDPFVEPIYHDTAYIRATKGPSYRENQYEINRKARTWSRRLIDPRGHVLSTHHGY